MTFLTTVALAAVLLVAAPFVAHRLRRRSAREQLFPPTRLVEPSPPNVRRRSSLEDRALFATRAAAIAALTILGATPFVRCSRLALERSGGASVAVAVVLDDSMSMRALLGASRSRFERARQGAREILASAREGDAIAIVLAGQPARVALAPTTDLAAARRALESLTESDRGTDLDGALVLARSLLSGMPQVDHRVALLSDLADGHPDAPPVGVGAGVPLWLALPELRAQGTDCGILSADRGGGRVRVHVACGPGASAAGRRVLVEDAAGKELAQASLGAGAKIEVDVALPSADAPAARVRLSGTDAVPADDAAPIVADARRGAIAVIADNGDESVATGGAPLAEQALSALKLDLDLRPLPSLPDRAEDLEGTLGILVDDPPGFTPEQRRVLAHYMNAGGVVLVALGPRAGEAPLGASLEPILTRAAGWVDTASPGADPATASAMLFDSARSLADLGAHKRARLGADDIAGLEPMLSWTDGAPLVARRAVGRGSAWIVTLPISVDASDLALRPGFLALLSAWADEARQRAAVRRSEVGTSWLFPAAKTVEVQGPDGPLAASRDGAARRVVPAWVGSYRLTVDGETEARVASPVPAELDLRPRTVESNAEGAAAGKRAGSVDVSGQVALGLLALVALEMALRLVSGGLARSRPDEA